MLNHNGQLMMLLVSIFITHYLADFWVQSQWMAENKSKKWPPLLLHIASYTLVIYLWGLIFTPWTFTAIVIFAVIQGGFHLVTDYHTSRMASKQFANGKTRRGFQVIGLDQLIHHICLTVLIITQTPLPA